MKLLALGKAWQHVWYRNYVVYARHWKTNMLPPLMQPIFWLLAMGVAVGSMVREDVNGLVYIVYVTPGIMVTESLLRAAFECTYGSFYRMKYQHTFDAIISTPVTPEQVAFGEVAWGATKSLISSTFLFIIVMGILVYEKMAITPGAFLAFPVVLLGGFAFAAASLTVSAKAREFEQFQFFFAIIFPLIFICGTYFPLSKFPVWLQYIIWVIPLTHIVDVTRGLISGMGTPYLALKILYIILSTAAMVEIAVRLMAKRLID